MNTTAEVLLIIVSATLAVFLVALSVALFYLISFLRDIKRISVRAESVASAMESAAHAFERTASPLAIIKLVSSVLSKVHKTSNKNKE